MEVGNEVKAVDWPSDKFRTNICKVVDVQLAKNRIMTPDLPVPQHASQIEEYVYSKSTTKEDYMKSIERAMSSLNYSLPACGQAQVKFNEDGTQKLDEENDFPSLKFRENTIRTFEMVHEKVGIPQQLTPQEEEQKLFDAHRNKEEYMVAFIEFLNSLREQQIKALEAIREKEVDPVVVPEPRMSIARPPVVLKPIPGCPPMPPSAPAPALPMSHLEARRSVFKRFVNLFSTCVRKNGKDTDSKKKKK